MARSRVGIKGSNQRRIKQRDEDSDESDEKDEEKDEEEDEDEEYYAEFASLGRKRNQRKKPQEKKVVYTEDDEDDANDEEYMYSGRKVNQKKNLWGKSEVSYTEEEEEEEEEEDDDDDDDDDDDLGVVSASRKRNQISKRHEKRIVSYKEDNQEEEEESDAEFKLSESDFVDDEDETPKMKKNKGLRSHSQKKNVPRGRKKSKKTKNPTKPKQRHHKSGPKLASSKEKPVTNKTKTENRSKISKNRKHRADWQRAMAESDSDFVSSASSDHEYTISEEEREQMREASIYCANLRAKLRSSSCGNQEKQPAYEQKKYPMRKGKEKVEDDIGKQVCGICLSEEQKRTMRGVLNCCRHYFCFACIMEWSKVESRCPLCKQRFTTITKSAKSDTSFDLRTVVVAVPECDQVYEPSEEELRGYLDPYENVICTECQNGGDDALMLLCDICDSSAHTFCVGLGREVPEGNWYCEGCRPTVFGTLNSDRRLSNNASDLSSPSPIPGGFDLNELYVPETPLTQQTRVLPEPNPASSGTVATTLRERRRLHRQRHHQLLNSNRMNDLVGRSSGTSASSSGIRLFGSQLDQARVSVSQNDHIFPYSRTDQLSVQVQNSNLASADVALQDEHVALPEFKMGICTDPPVH
ncbi:putative chromatin regulator PHD family [Helianthus debilis subsp. tardiflorus]